MYSYIYSHTFIHLNISEFFQHDYKIGFCLANVKEMMTMMLIDYDDGGVDDDDS